MLLFSDELIDPINVHSMCSLNVSESIASSFENDIDHCLIVFQDHKRYSWKVFRIE